MSLAARCRLLQARLEAGRDPGRVDRFCRHCGVQLVGVGRGRVVWIDRLGERLCAGPVRLEHLPRPRTFRVGIGGAISSAGERS